MEEDTKIKEKWLKFQSRQIQQAATAHKLIEQEQSDPRYHYFMAGKKDFKEVFKEQQDTLIQALEIGDWGHPVFLDETIEYIALDCFKNGNITYQQFVTIVEREQQKKDFGDTLETYSLLDEDGRYTKHAELFLVVLTDTLEKKKGIYIRHAYNLALMSSFQGSVDDPNVGLEKGKIYIDPENHKYKLLGEDGQIGEGLLSDSIDLKDLRSKLNTVEFKAQILEYIATRGHNLRVEPFEKLRVLIQALPKSEQMVYHSKVPIGAFYQSDMPPGGSLSGNTQVSLLGRMEEVGALLFLMEKDETPVLISMSSGVADAVAIICYGLKRYVNPLYRRGPMSIRDIEAGIRVGIRPTNLCLLQDDPPKVIHEFQNPGLVSITAHDKYHVDVMSRLTLEHRAAFVRMIDVAREGLSSLFLRENKNVPNLMTMETWFYTDMVFPIKSGIAFFQKKVEIKKSTEEFCRNLAKLSKSNSRLKDNYSGFFNADGKVSVFGMLVWIDMVKNPDSWSNQYNIDPSYLTEPFASAYQLIVKIIQHNSGFLENSPELQALKLYAIEQLPCAIEESSLESILLELENYYSGSEGVFMFQRNGANATLLRNQIDLHIPEEHRASLEQLIRNFMSIEAEVPSRFCCAIL